jgi:DNA-binding transcriptional ArsR family regulator
MRAMDAALKALAEPRRREILRIVWSREVAASDIAAHFDVTRSAISQHLSVLKDADLVSERREGTRRYYRARTETIDELRAFLDDYWTTGLSRLRDAAERASGRTGSMSKPRAVTSEHASVIAEAPRRKKRR